MLWATVTTWRPEEKKKTVKGDRDKPAMELLMVKSVFSLEQDGELVNSKNVPWADGVRSFL